jgi:hypothetical protein
MFYIFSKYVGGPILGPFNTEEEANQQADKHGYTTSDDYFVDKHIESGLPEALKKQAD